MVCLTFTLNHLPFPRRCSAPKRKSLEVGLLKSNAGMSTEQREEVMKRVKAFQAEVASGLSENIGAPDRSVDDQWKDLSGLLVQAGNDILGFARCHQPDWFTSNQ